MAFEATHLPVAGARVSRGMLLGALAVLATAAVASAARPVSMWNATGWLFTYGQGLRRRALLGTLADAFTPSALPTFRLVTFLSVLALTGVVVLLLILIRDALEVDGALAALLAGVALLVSPVGLRFLAADLGRPDHLSYVLLLAGLLLISRVGPVTAAAIVAVLGVFGVLVQELFLVAFLPLLLVALLIRVDLGVRRGTAAGVARVGLFAGALLPALGAAAWVFARGVIAPDEAVARAAELDGLTDIVVLAPAALVHAHTLGDNVGHVVEVFATQLLGRLLGGVLLPGLLAVGTVAFAVAALRRWRTPSLPRWGLPNLRVSAATVVLFAGASPLLLNVVAIDHGRWWALATINVVVGVLWLLALNGRLSPPWPEPATWSPATVLFAGLVLLLLTLAPTVEVEFGFVRPASGEVVRVLSPWP